MLMLVITVNNMMKSVNSTGYKYTRSKTLLDVNFFIARYSITQSDFEIENMIYEENNAKCKLLFPPLHRIVY